MKNSRFYLLATLSLMIAAALVFQSCDEEENETTNNAPTCSITNPSFGAEITQGETVMISVEAEDEDNNLREVRFYIDGTDVGSSNSFPYNYEWETVDASEGSHTIKAVALDEEQAEAEDEVEVTIVSVNNNTPPTASFTVSPSSGSTSTNFAFDATGSTDNEDPTSQLEVRWDFDGDGSWDTGWDTDKTENYQYSNEDTYAAKLEVRDTEGLTDQYNRSITVDNGGGTVDIEWVSVTGGTFQMGSNDGGSNEQPIHTVTLSSFEISKYEITNAQYAEFLNDINCNSDGSYNDDEYGNVEYIVMNDSDCQVDYSGGQFAVESGKDNHPVIEVSWYGANAFAQWAGGRLPTEAEWEFAARGGNQSQGYQYSGSDNLDEVGWYSGNSSGQTHEVGQKQANELGIYDMSGNVWEWCHDWYDSDYYSNSPENNPQGPSSGSKRVLRGGSWGLVDVFCRVALRVGGDPGDSVSVVGFRIVQ